MSQVSSVGNNPSNTTKAGSKDARYQQVSSQKTASSSPDPYYCPIYEDSFTTMQRNLDILKAFESGAVAAKVQGTCVTPLYNREKNFPVNDSYEDWAIEDEKSKESSDQVITSDQKLEWINDARLPGSCLERLNELSKDQDDEVAKAAKNALLKLVPSVNHFSYLEDLYELAKNKDKAISANAKQRIKAVGPEVRDVSSWQEFFDRLEKDLNIKVPKNGSNPNQPSNNQILPGIGAPSIKPTPEPAFQEKNIIAKEPDDQ